MLTHLDIIKIFGHRSTKDLSIFYIKIAIALKNMDMYSEVNTAGLRKPVFGKRKMHNSVMKKCRVTITLDWKLIPF
jgi:hypothetical protein